MEIVIKEKNNECNIFDFNKRVNMVNRNVRQISRYLPYNERSTIFNTR